MEKVKHKRNIIVIEEYEEGGITAATFMTMKDPEWYGSEFVMWGLL
jgi:hypothetical protein